MSDNKTSSIATENESVKLKKASFAAIAGVLFSRASGVVRTSVVNATFGVNVSLDAFNAAFRFPNSLRDLFADGALSASFIKVLVEERTKGGDAEKKLIRTVIGFFSFVTFSIAIIAAFFSYPFMEFIGSDEFKRSGGLDLASFLFKILAFYLPFTMLNAVAMAVLGVLGQTFRAMNGSVFLNVGIIGMALSSPFFQHFGFNPVVAVAIGAMLGVIFQMIYQFLPLYKLGMLTWPSFNIKEWISYKPLHEVLILMLPRALGQGAMILALLINTFFAIQVGAGALTYIITATMIIQVPIGLFGVATGFAALPVLSKAIVEGQNKRFSNLLVESLDTAMWLAAMTTACFAFLIVPFYAVLFQHGAVNYNDTLQNSIAVCAYSIGIIFASGSKILLNAFYAINSTKQIVYNAFFYLVINATLSSILAPKFGILGLGISYGTSTAFDFFLNFYFLKRRFQKNFFGDSPYIEGGSKFTLRIFCFAFLAYILGLSGVVLVKYFWQDFSRYISFELNFVSQFLILSVGGIVFCVINFFLIKFFAPTHLKELLNKATQKFKR
ncbi:murein biosynthesis integral membrane protein MurJ [Fluviispira multicolorata]|uniref:Murein biosynthesis integral membrane protein MurJ n=1 Tax=Fluviispira multicolorata TaxID=2654512 RepID=A0A833N7I7_9BACT|nr:murein biosynthesis integral membrane protein MurJ [Fluviispira multicolorata]KAB8032215.1 murein biosynthesis integral membrane protein MurJ [Fluviispira multicolorata]